MLQNKLKKLFFLFIFSFLFAAFSQDIKHNPWSLIIYRSENDSRLNTVRSYVRIQDMDGNDVIGTKAKAFYEWTCDKGKYYGYKKNPYLIGGMAMHLNLKKGKYRISVFTPESELEFFEGEAKGEWKSEAFIYDTENPLKVIFVYPGANENGFYNGTWYVSYKAPLWHKFTRPVM